MGRDIPDKRESRISERGGNQKVFWCTSSRSPYPLGKIEKKGKTATEKGVIGGGEKIYFSGKRNPFH